MARKSAALMDQGQSREASQQRGSVTLKEVALRAGVSPSVASTVLSGKNNNIRVGQETQSRVREAAQTLGYRTRYAAILPTLPPRQHNDGEQENLRGVRRSANALASITVGIIASFNPNSGLDAPASDFDPWEHDIPAGFEIALNEGVPQVIAHYCNRGRRGELPIPIEEAVAQVLALGVDALALIEISSSSQVVGRSLPVLMATGRPFVVISTDALSAPVANVFFDNINAGYIAARHLIEQGYEELCFLAPLRVPWADERIAGAREALMHSGLPPERLQIYPAEAERIPLPSFDVRKGRWDHLASGREAGQRLLAAGGVLPSAIIAANDATAAGFLEVAQNNGLTAGIDFALMGFDDAPEARQHSLTTVRPPREAMGREAARLLLHMTAGDRTACAQVCLNSHLMTRRSTPPRAALISPSRNTKGTQEPLSPLPLAEGIVNRISKGTLK